MKPLSLGEVCRIVVGATPAPLAGAQITSVSTDTRTIIPNSLFVAIRGETHDGHEYLAQAAAAGATAALVDRDPPAAPASLTLIRVDDARQAMGRLARHVRQQMTAKVIAVGGSNGKTGTKHLIDSALRLRKRGTFSPKSFNNDIGAPLAIFPADPNQDYLVLELGTNHHGEIRTLTHIALPDVAVITNVSAEHLEGLGDLGGVRREEASLIEGLDPDGLLVVNGDDDALLDAVAPYKGRRVTFGLSTENDLFPTDIRGSLDGVRFRLNGNARREFFLPLLGQHVAVNAVAAIAVARELGLKNDEIAGALASATGPEMRLQLQRTAAGVTLLNDAYNANPASVKAALDTLCSLPSPARRRIAVLGDMRELGDATDRLHREVGQFVGTKSPDLELLICVGEKAALIADEARDAGLGHSRVVHYPGTSEASKHITGHIRDGDLVLLKGSRYMKLERLAECLARPA